MLYQTAAIENGKMVITSSKEIDQRSLTADCWLVQFQGLSACKTCQYKRKKNCGGGMTLKALRKKAIAA
jgi:hypothetical protein